MIIEIGELNLLILLKTQLKNNFLLDLSEEKILEEKIKIALSKSEVCFFNLKNKYYKKNDKLYFNPYQSSQYCIFLYFLSFEVAKDNIVLGDKIYYLNKMLNSIDLYHQVRMPSIFSVDHPVGSVVGRAEYKGRIHISQNCTIGNNKNKYPIIGDNVLLLANVTIVGSTKIGDNVIISSGTYIKDEDIPNDCIVFGRSPNLIIKSLTNEVLKMYQIF